MAVNLHFTPQWKEHQPVDIPENLREAVSGPDLLLQTLIRRGMSDPQKARAFLFFDEYKPAPSIEFPDMDKAVQRIKIAIKNHEKIGIWGDFDVDGQTSTSILVGGLRRLSADVVFHIPIRATESHGILLEALRKFLQLGVSLVVTCDTGISANDSIEFAMQSGVDVIVTDHHSLPEILPAAYALINPHFLPENHSLQTLSGSGVAYKVIEQLFQEFGQIDQANEFIDLAALGLVADLATLTGDARYLVQRGLEQMRNHPRPAFKKIFAENDIQASQVNEETISFVLAPRMNAVGRLSDANPMVEFLLSEDPVYIATTVNLIEGLNSQRKILCSQVLNGALSQLEQNPKLLDHSLLLLSHQKWPAGVIGIVASRLVELYHRPAILMNITDSLARGSARSIENVDISKALVENKELLESFGGHPMAAGLVAAEENIESLRRGLSRSVTRMIEEAKIEPILEIDSNMDLSCIDLDLLSSLDLLAPFGPGNPPLQFVAKNLELVEAIPFGKGKEHLQMLVQSSDGTQYHVVWWQGADLPQPENRFDLVYKTRINIFRGVVEVRFEWVDFREISEEIVSSRQKGRKKKIINLDYRDSRNPEQVLQNILTEQPAQVWSEGLVKCPVSTRNRIELSNSSTLVIWTAPPSPQVFLQILEKVKPEKLYWFNKQTNILNLRDLIRECYSLLRKTCSENSSCFVSVEEYSMWLGTTPQIVNLIIQGLQAQGLLEVSSEEGYSRNIRLKRTNVDNSKIKEIQASLETLQKEIQAYRELYQKTPVVIDLLPGYYKSE